MNSTQLAQVFDDAGRYLETEGHLILVRRARQFLHDGRVDLASAFLLEAKRRMPIDHVSRLCDAFGDWRRNEGDVEVLLNESTWREACRRENSLPDLLADRTRDIGYASLLGSLSRPEAPLMPTAEPEPIEEPSLELEWEEEPTSEIFEAQTVLLEMPRSPESSIDESASVIPDSLVVGVITMLFVLTIYFCFFRSF